MKVFKTRTRARYCETDAAEVIYYGSFLHYFEVGKMEMFRELKLPYDYRIPIVETACKYPAPARFDDLLEIRSWFDDVRDKGFKVRCELRCGGLVGEVGDVREPVYGVADEMALAVCRAAWQTVARGVGPGEGDVF